jgi:hypothetical protein
MRYTGEFGHSRPQVVRETRTTRKGLPPFGKGGRGIGQIWVGEGKGRRHQEASGSVNMGLPRYQTATAISCSIAERTPQGNRGQGLFVAKTYMAKMGGTISARNVEDGVSFLLTLQRVRSGQGP